MSKKCFKKRIAQLKSVCNGIFSRFEEAAKVQTLGSSFQELTKKIEAGSQTYSQVQLNEPEAIEDFRILSHSFLVQEWHMFLDNIYKETVLHLLNKCKKIEIKESIRVNEIDFDTIIKTRTSVAECLAQDFVFEKYEDKIQILGRLFKKEIPSSFKDSMRKHVKIRNVFQHNRGVIRNEDLRDLGAHSIALTDRDGNTKDFKANEKIKLSICDIRELKELIENFSKEYEEIT